MLLCLQPNIVRLSHDYIVRCLQRGTVTSKKFSTILCPVNQGLTKLITLN